MTKQYICTSRSISRCTNGNARTNRTIEERKQRLKAPYFGSFFPAPGSFEPCTKNKAWCQIHAVNNALGYAYVTMKGIEAFRRKQKNNGVGLGGQSGFWKRPFFLRAIQQKYGIGLESAKLGTDGKNPQFLQILEQKNPDWRQKSFLVYLQYDTKDKEKGKFPILRQEVKHAVALRDGHILDSDISDKFYTLEDYPLLNTITALYIITTCACP
jgi:hypothetical protein